MKLQSGVGLIVISILVIVLSSCQSECPSNLVFDATQIEQIKTHNQCQATIRGVVLNTYASLENGVIFLNLGNSNYKQAFSVVIFEDSLSKFHDLGIDKPEEFYQNKIITVTGTISLYQGRPQIIVENPQQIFLQ